MKWEKQEIGKELVNEITKKYGCDPLTAAILVRRGIIDGNDILFYLENDSRYLYNPFLFKNMEDAVDRILDAKEEGEKVLIFGDRDVDGITATTLLYEALKEMGMDVSWRIPTGNETYGLSTKAVESHAENNGTLIITVDCGISNFEEIKLANEKGIDVIVVDHHTPQEAVPNAVVIINPKMPDSGYPHQDLSGCAVAWKLVTALRIAALPLYKQQICLMNVRPINEAYAVEAVKLFNMTETQRITETIVPGMLPFEDTRLGAFLSGQQIFVWDASLQRKQLEKIFGKGVEFNFFDFQLEAAKIFPKLGSISLLRLKDMSKIGKYSKGIFTELDGFINIFITYFQHTNKIYGKKEQQEIQLAALSTLADMMDLTGENRIIVKQGLKEINAKPRLGLSDLMSRQGLLGTPIGTETISWNISPLINAAGRMGSSETAVELFTAETSAERTEKANAIFEMNEKRKTLGAEGWSIAMPLAAKNLQDFSGNLAVAVSGSFHRGITGILAGKLAEYFKVPSMVICLMDDGKAVASMRSARGYRILSILEPFSDMFLDYGGHSFAAGLSIEQKKLPQFLEAVKSFSASMEFDQDSESEILKIDAELPPDYLKPDILDLVDRFEPYGINSPQLLFCTKKMKIVNANIVGKSEPFHIKLNLDTGLYKWNAIYWKAADKLNTDFKQGDYIDAVFHIERNIFNGAAFPQLVIKDIVQCKK